VLAALVIALVGFGVVMVYSASAIEATVRHHDAQFFLKRQAAYAAVAVVAMWLTSRIDYRRIKVLTYPILFAVTAMLVLVVAGFGHRAGNAYRWITLGPVHIQPAEAAKLGIVVWLAYSLSKKADKIKSFSVGFVPHILVVGVLALLCLKQPDFGSAVVLTFLTFTLLFVAGARIPYIASAAVLLGASAVLLVWVSEYRFKRYLAWTNMEANRNDLAYQPFQSVMSFGSGGPTGLGLGRGLQVLYLPEAHTDFVSAIIGEELGFLGILGLCAAYLVIVSRGVKIALEAADDYGSFMAFGVSTMFGVQALTNLAVAMAIFPTKGLTLPFLSYGGSSLLVNAVAVGILLSISRPRTALPERAPEPQFTNPRGVAPSASALVATAAGEGSPAEGGGSW
jgi:cell division protein FtsW